MKPINQKRRKTEFKSKNKYQQINKSKKPTTTKDLKYVFPCRNNPCSPLDLILFILKNIYKRENKRRIIEYK